eukprot:7390630-Prymnesium_polylepis.1
MERDAMPPLRSVLDQVCRSEHPKTEIDAFVFETTAACNRLPPPPPHSTGHAFTPLCPPLHSFLLLVLRFHLYSPHINQGCDPARWTSLKSATHS